MRKMELIVATIVGTLAIASSMFAAGRQSAERTNETPFEQVQRIIGNHKIGELNSPASTIHACGQTPITFFKDQGMKLHATGERTEKLNGKTCVYNNGLKITYWFNAYGLDMAYQDLMFTDLVPTLGPLDIETGAFKGFRDGVRGYKYDKPLNAVILNAPLYNEEMVVMIQGKTYADLEKAGAAILACSRSRIAD